MAHHYDRCGAQFIFMVECRIYIEQSEHSTTKKNNVYHNGIIGIITANMYRMSKKLLMCEEKKTRVIVETIGNWSPIRELMAIL
jgi:hypothetical protein